MIRNVGKREEYDGQYGGKCCGCRGGVPSKRIYNFGGNVICLQD